MPALVWDAPPPRRACAALVVAFLGALPATRAHAADEPAAVSASAFVDAYLAADLDEDGDRIRPPFLFNHVRDDEFNVNLALLRLATEGALARGAVGLMGGTYAQSNLAHEQPQLRQVFEARAGARVVSDLWLDAGIFPSHLGFESAISLDDLTLTRSLVAESSPYYLAGARLTWEGDGPVGGALVVANGWQNVRETNRSKGVGTQLVVRPMARVAFNWSTWTSDEAPAGDPGLRVFNDVYATVDLDRVELVGGVDAGVQDRGETWAAWMGAAVLGRVWLTDVLALNGRIERYADPRGIIVAIDGDGVVLNGGSIGADLYLREDVALRTEGRLLVADRDVFPGGPFGDEANVAITTSLAARFGGAI